MQTFPLFFFWEENAKPKTLNKEWDKKEEKEEEEEEEDKEEDKDREDKEDDDAIVRDVLVFQ